MNSQTDYAVSPGSYLREWLEDEGITQQDLADRLGTSRKTVNQIVRGGHVSPDLSVRLGRVTPFAADVLLQIQAQFEADRERLQQERSLGDQVDRITKHVRAFLKKHGFVKSDARNRGKLGDEFLRFHGVATWEAFDACRLDPVQSDYALAFRKESRSSEVDPVALATWLRACELAPEMDGVEGLTYSESSLWEILPEVRHRAACPDGAMFDDIARMLRTAGVVLTHLDPPASFPLYGVTRWVRGVPVIHQTFRRRRDGYVTFTLFHELGHVLHDPQGEMHLDDIAAGVKSNSEKRANAFALDILLPQEHRVRVRSLRYDNEILDVARELDVSPGFLVFYMQRTNALDRRHGNALPVQL